jgi:drug/metabolite transporter (DMT)-like permease
MSTREKKIAYIAWITICVVWGTTYLANRVALESLPVALLAGFRWTAAGLLLMAALPFFNMTLPPLRTWRSIAVVGFLMNVMGNGILVWAQQYVPSGLAAVVVAMVPFWSVAVEALLPRGERITRRTLLGLAAGMGGIVVLMWPALTVGGRDGRMFVLGIVALQVGSIAWAIGTSYTKRHSLGSTPLASSALQMVFSGLILLAAGTMLGEWGRVAFTPRTFTALAYLAVFGSAIGYTAYVYAVKYLPLSTVSLYAYVNPIIAVILGTLILSEPFSARIVVAAGLVFLGIAIVRSNSSAPPMVNGARPALESVSKKAVA